MLQTLTEKIDFIIIKCAKFLLKGEDPNSKTLLLFLGLPILASVIILCLIFIPSFVKEKKFNKQLDFIEALKSQDWKALYVDPKPDAASWDNCFADLMCPGNPESKVLFDNGEIRGDKHEKIVSELRGKRFWIGRKFTARQLTDWKKAGADKIILGYFYATYELFLDGKKKLTRDGLTSRLPLILDIPENTEKDVFVAIRILHDMDEPFPDALFVSGVLSDYSLERHLRDNEFQTLVKPSLAIGFSLALGFLFLLLWLVSWKRQEFAAFSASAILQAASQLLLIHFVWLHIGNYYYHRIAFVLSWYHALVIIFIGLAVARIRTWYSSLFMLIMLVIPWLFFLTDWTTDQFYYGALSVYRIFEFSSYFIAIALILLQARLVSQKRGELWDPYREHKLYLFALLLLFMALVQIMGDVAVWDIRVIFSEVVISILAIFMVQEYGRQSNFVSRSPISKFHQLAKSISELPCFIFSLDLKNSETLFRMGAEQGIGGSLVKKLMYQLSNLVVEKGGEIITAEGDSMIAFVPITQSTEESLKKIVQICIELEKSLKQYLQLTNLSDEFKLRIALDKGNIRPIWHEIGGKKLPGWEQVGTSTVFVDLARMLEAESKLNSRDITALVTTPELKANINLLNTGLSFKSAAAVIKHGRNLNVDIAVLDSSPN